MEEEKLVPQQREGGATGATARRTAVSAEVARNLFRDACERMLNVNSWYDYAGRKGTEFQLTDAQGNPLSRTEAQEGDLIRINIPAPPNAEGGDYDWVVIEKFDRVGEDSSGKQSFGFRVRPVPNPGKAHSQEAHFYTQRTTSTFLICRSGATVYAMERGRNEKPNLKGSFWNKVRNFFVGLGAMLGLSIPMWKLWAESMLEPRRK